MRRPHITKAADGLVRPALEGDLRVVVAHSLGTIVSYRLLRTAVHPPHVPLFVTLGSPLGIDVVKEHLNPPRLGVPVGVGHWLNAADERDYVALHSRLAGGNFAEGIEDIPDVHNRKDDAHSIVDYLSDASVARRIHAALTERTVSGGERAPGAV